MDRIRNGLARSAPSPQADATHGAVAAGRDILGPSAQLVEDLGRRERPRSLIQEIHAN